MFLCLLINLIARRPPRRPAITARGDAVRRPLTLVSFSALISNALSSFFFFSARRLFYRGSSLGGIASDPLRAGGGITAWWDAARRPLILFPFSISIPNAALSPRSSSLRSPRSFSLRDAVAPDGQAALSPAGSSSLRDAVAPDGVGPLSPRSSSTLATIATIGRSRPSKLQLRPH